eukprot:m.229440 g.229440  ORF g.229440 m.229440 type:complete len:546 (+) comp17742_c0_seq1:1808-3445(+)
MAAVAKPVRARALDHQRPMMVFRGDEDKDVVAESTTIARAVAVVPTGMEKAEEEEHHIQAALSTQQLSGTMESTLVIPVPESVGLDNDTEPDNRTFKIPKQYIRVNLFNFEEEPPTYDMDTEDEEWLAAVNKTASDARPHIPEEKFERMMERLDQATLHGTFNERDLGQLLAADDSIVKLVYDYFRAKLKRLKRDAITPYLRIGKGDDPLTANDPYVCFRRRTERMQTRKNRKNDETGYMNMVKLLRDFERLRQITDMVRKREKRKKELLKLDMEIAEHRIAAEDWDGVHVQDLHTAYRPPPIAPLRLPLPAVAAAAAAAAAAARANTVDRIKRKQKADDFPEDEEETEDYQPQYTKKKHVRAPREGLDSPVVVSDSSEDESFNVTRRVGALYHAPLPGLRTCPARRGGFHRAMPLFVGPGQQFPDAHSLPRPVLRGYCRRRMGRGGRIFIDRVVPERDPCAFGDSDDDEDMIQLMLSEDFKTKINTLYTRIAHAPQAGAGPAAAPAPPTPSPSPSVTPSPLHFDFRENTPSLVSVTPNSAPASP